MALAAAIHLAWAALTLCARAIPAPLLALGGGAVLAWHMSLQHETLHGHPTRWRRVNDAIGLLPLSLWLPYGAYRRSHLRHHRDEHLTDPIEDPESYYADPAVLARMPRTMLRVLVFNNTLPGRVTIGPLLSIGSFARGEVRRLAAGDRRAWRDWTLHAVLAAAVLGWIVGICGMGVGRYVLCFVYPGAAIGLVRSFAEHRASPDHTRRTAIVERGGVLGILFLFNNLHVIHHERPGLPWYRLPAAWRANEARIRAGGGPVYRGYGEIARLYWRRPHHHPAHPIGRA